MIHFFPTTFQSSLFLLLCLSKLRLPHKMSIWPDFFRIYHTRFSSSLMHGIMCSIKLRSFSASISSNIPSVSLFLWDLSLNVCWYTWCCPTDLWALFNFRHSFLPQFLKMDNLNWPIFKFTDTACSSLLLLFTSEFFYFSYCIFNSGFLFGCFMTYLLYWYLLFGIFFSYLPFLFFIRIFVLRFLDHV